MRERMLVPETPGPSHSTGVARVQIINHERCWVLRNQQRRMYSGIQLVADFICSVTQGKPTDLSQPQHFCPHVAIMPVISL